MTICFGRRPPYADKDDEIAETFDDVNDSYPDRSTEFCIHMTADRCGVTYDRVVAALARVHTERKK